MRISILQILKKKRKQMLEMEEETRKPELPDKKQAKGKQIKLDKLETWDLSIGRTYL